MEESEIIDKYLRGELDKEQFVNFTREMQTNSELQKKVALRRLVIAGISQAYADELKTKLADFDRSLESKKRFQFSWKMAAAFVMLLMATFAIYFYQSKSDAEDFMIAEPGLPILMGLSSDVEFNNAMSAYKTSDYQTSGVMFKKLLLQNPKSDTLLYFSGWCELQLKRNFEAIQMWDQVNPESIFYSKTQYMMGVAWWQLNEEPRAKEIFLPLTTSADFAIRESALKALKAMQ